MRPFLPPPLRGSEISHGPPLSGSSEWVGGTQDSHTAVPGMGNLGEASTKMNEPDTMEGHSHFSDHHLAGSMYAASPKFRYRGDGKTRSSAQGTPF